MSPFKIILIAILMISCNVFSQDKNLALGRKITVNSENPLYPAKNAVDGKINRHSKWMSENVKPPHIMEVDFEKYCNIKKVVIYTGIPPQERTVEESSQAEGFWSAKNFKIQYWDDANWTDIPNTEVHENRLTKVEFNFLNSINTFRIRFICDDGEPISIMEFEIYGSETNNPAPVINDTALAKKVIKKDDQSVFIKVENQQIGNTMKYVGYNQGYYMPGSNASGWIEYSGVNSLRVWTTLNSYVPTKAVEVDPNLNTVTDFDKRKGILRQNPESNKYLKWDVLLPLYANTEKTANTNPMILDYVLSELKRLNIDPVIQIGNTDFNDKWSNKWQQWQRFYALAYYMAKKGDVTMFAMQNEPNHKNSGMNLNQWISGMQIVSDAIHCAVEDVNKGYRKNLRPKMVGPVTAGNNPEWWAAVAKNIRTDYHGNTIDRDLIEIFSTHSYNSPAAGYLNRVTDIRKIITENHPKNFSLPIVYTEIGRWMNAYLIDKEETMDSPSLFTEWAGIYTNNTKNGAYGMWAFKFSNTSSDVYSQGVKSGHHFTWQGQRIVEDAYKNILQGGSVTSYNKSNAQMITDGVKTNASLWKSDTTSKDKWLIINLSKTVNLKSVIIYTGSDGGVYTAPDRIKNFKLQYLEHGTWNDIEGGVIKDNKFAQLYLNFKKVVNTDKIRFLTQDAGVIKVREIKGFAQGDGPSDEKNYDISGIQRTGEVVRLFAKGFKEERPMYKTSSNIIDENLDAITSFDSQTGNYYMWLVQRGEYKNKLNIDLSALNVPVGTPVSAECVSPNYFGEIMGIYPTDKDGKIKVELDKQSVLLLTIPSSNLKKMIIKPAATGTASKISIPSNGSVNKLEVQLNAAEPLKNKISYIEFPTAPVLKGERAFLKVVGKNSTDNEIFLTHVYAIPERPINAEQLTWNNAPLLDSKESLIRSVGTEATIVGEIGFSGTKKEHILDITKILKNNSTKPITFVIIRETRQMGDDLDKEKKVVIEAKGSNDAPIIEIWKNK
ncbi:discoidin domain-containing protein [Pedobacter sp. Leaf194]|uniref:discoidin domain-containing protein n=1 Tax=Pedobacter sp. Leaf194 TaxID=1736297 RepID=UPI000702BA27|nr:discoidin domain-containing protein [Pedobacter sp. Leaf194]KQS36782.1 carbohydrate-binding protein [Pedobacter sp. Leaf194]